MVHHAIGTRNGRCVSEALNQEAVSRRQEAVGNTQKTEAIGETY